MPGLAILDWAVCRDEKVVVGCPDSKRDIFLRKPNQLPSRPDITNAHTRDKLNEAKIIIFIDDHLSYDLLINLLQQKLGKLWRQTTQLQMLSH